VFLEDKETERYEMQNLSHSFEGTFSVSRKRQDPSSINNMKKGFRRKIVKKEKKKKKRAKW
jgi:hypothetical protein